MARKEAALMVYIPDDLKRKIDAEKKASGVSLRAIIEKALRAWLDKRAA